MSDGRTNWPVPDELAHVRAEIKRLEDRESELRRILLTDETTRTGADWLAEIRVTKRTTTDLKELRAMHPEIVEQYTFPQEITQVVLSGINADTGEIVSARKMKAQEAQQ